MIIHVVLVRTKYSGNIGAAARAVANMGADRLILIDPKCPLDIRAKEMAAGAQEKLAAVQTFASWGDFYKCEGTGVRIALSHRCGRRRRIFPLEETLERLSAVSDKQAQRPPALYLIFGPEDRGLNRDDLAFVNFTVHLPVFSDFASFNLAQAVLLTLFIARQKFPPARGVDAKKAFSQAQAIPFYFPDELIKEWLTTMGFNIKARRASAYLTLKRLLLANRPTQHEVHVLESILRQNIRKLSRSINFSAKNLADDLTEVVIKNI